MPRPPPPNAAFTIRGKPISPASSLGLGGVGDRLFGAGNHRDAGTLGQAARRGLVPQKFQNSGAGTDESDAGTLAGLGQRRVLRKEAVARVDGVHTLLQGERNNPVQIEICLYRAKSFTHHVGLVGLEAVETEPVLLGEDGHGAQAQFRSRTHDPNGDFATIQS